MLESDVVKRILRILVKYALRYSSLAPRGVVVLRRGQQRIRDAGRHGSPTPGRPRLYVSMIGDPATLSYALGQWKDVLESSEVSLIVAKTGAVLPGDLPNGWSVISRADLIALHATGDQAGSVVLYMVNSKKNFGLMGRLYRFRHLLVFHGEGDKLANQNASWRAYPEIAVSGDAAVERLRRIRVRSRLHVIGRPQVPSLATTGLRRDGAILYAPTWEGENERENYSSLGMGLLEALLEFIQARGQRLVVKMHPKTGARRADFAHALSAWERAAERTPGLILASTERDVREYFDEASVLVTDISSVATDFMPSLKPIVYLNPFDIDRAEFSARFPTTRHAPVASNPDQLRRALVDACAEGYVVGPERQAVIRHVVPFWGAESRRAFFRALALDGMQR